MPQTEPYVLGENDALLTFGDAREHRDIALDMLRQARRTLRIFTRDLDHAVYDTAEFCQAATALARRSRFTRVMILVQDSATAVRQGHCLTDLAQKLSSHVEIRKPAKEYASLSGAFMIVDDAGYISRQLGTHHKGTASFADRWRARDLTTQFDEIWERSQQDPQLRRLYL